MKKPDHGRGIGVHFEELRLAAKASPPLRDPQYLNFLLRMAVEKLNAINLSRSLPEVLEILDREEWPSE